MKSLKRVLRPKAKPRAKTPSKPKGLVVGLRNPGPEYTATRHNLGFEVVSTVVNRAGEALKRAPSRVRGLIAAIDDGTAVLVPNTFMNESGQSVRAMLSYFKIDPSDMLVIHDDIDLPFGRLRIQVGGGSGGHNGVRSVEASLRSADFSRLKIGVGRPPGSMDPADFVLRPFTKKERPEVDLIVEEAADIVEMWPRDRQRAQEAAALRGRDD